MFARILFLLIFVLSSSEAASESIHFVIPEFKPFTYSNNSAPAGVGVDMISEILADMKWSYSIQVVPNYGRALAEVKSGRADGFFLATENSERNQYATLTTPVVINNWSWFYKDKGLQVSSDSFKASERIGTILNTNTHKWLKGNDYRISHAATEPRQLVELLEKNRLDAVFMAEAVFLDAVADYDNKPLFKQYIEFAKPMGVYVSKAFLEKHPEFLPRLNQLIDEKTESIPLN